MQKLLSAVLFVLSAIVLGLCVQFAYENGDSGCTAANEAPLGTEILERKISSLLHLSDDNVNKSFKWPYEASSVNESRVLSGQNFVSYSPAESGSKNQTAAAAPGSSDDGGYDEQEYITAVSSKLLHFSRPFDASTSPSASTECRQHTKLFLNSLNNLELWAVKMYDSSSRLPSGILNGNINQFGDFDQCLSVQGPSDNLQGQYCLAYVQPTVSKNTPHLRSLFNLVESHGAFRSAFNDPGHRVPRFSLINWAVCVPSSCTPQDVEYSVREYLEDLANGTGISVQVRVEPKMCHVKKGLVLDNSILLVGAFFLAVIAISIISTLYDLTTEPSYQNNWLVAFSLRKNFRWLFSTRPLTDDISAAHGIRFLNAFMLLISHKTLAIFFNPYVNRTYMTESLGHPWTVFGRAASIYTDPFLLLSGMLTSYSMFGKLNRGQSVQLKREYFGRLLRILPPLGAIILFCTYILPILGSGPQWNLVVTHHSDLCKRNWWRNILFIHNYFGFSEMCLTHTHHLGIDTELFAIAPIMILGLWKWPRKGLIVLISLATLGTAARFYTTIANSLSNYIYYGTTIQRLFKTADYMYSFPPYRSTVYILGILLGYALQKYRGYQLTSKQLKYGWIIALICFFCTIIGPAPMSDINYKYNPIHAAFYAALSPLGWCAYFSWIIFTSHLGYRSKCSEFFSWRGFQITTKLSYSIYLTQFPVFFFNVGRRRFVNYFSFLPVVVDIQEFICIAIASICLTLLFDAPFQNIKSILFKKNTLKNKLSQITDKCKTANCNDNYVKNTKD